MAGRTTRRRVAAGIITVGVVVLVRVGFWVLAGIAVAVVGGNDPAPGELGSWSCAAAGFALGLVGTVWAPIAAGTAMLVAGVRQATVWWWMLPAFVGWLVYAAAIILAGYGRGGPRPRERYAPSSSGRSFLLNLYRALLDRWVYRRSALPGSSPLGMRLSGEPGVRLAEAFGLAVLAVPFYAFAVVRDGTELELLWLVILGLIHVRFFIDTADLSRYRRQEVRVSTVAWVLSIWLLSAGTPGEAMAKILHVPNNGAFWSLVQLCAATLALLAVFGLQSRAFRTLALGWFKRPRARVRFGFASAYGVVLGVAWFGVLAWVAHGQGPDPFPVSWFVLLMLVGYPLTRRWIVRQLYQFDAALYARSFGRARTDLRNVWSYDVYVSPTAPPNYRLVRSLAELGIDFVQGRPLLPTVGYYGEMIEGRLNQKDAAAAWVHDAFQLLNQREPPVSDYSPQARKWRQYHYMSRALCYDALGRVHRFTGYIEDASVAYLRAAEMCRRVNASNTAAIMLINAQLTLDVAASDVLVELKRAMSEPGIVPALRRRLIVLAAVAHHRAGDRAGCARLIESAPTLLDRFRTSGPEADGEKVRVRKVDQQVVVTVGGAVVVGFYSDEDSAILEEGLSYLDSRSIASEQFPLIRSVWHGAVEVPRRRCVVRGLRAAESGRPRRGVVWLNFAIRGLERRAVYALSVELREYLGLHLVDVDPAQALHHLSAAMDIREASRHRVVADRRRAALGGTFQQLYDAVMAILARHGDVLAPRLPDPLPITALWFAEAARSRSLVDLLGETMRYPMSEELLQLLRLRSRVRRLHESSARGPRRDPSSGNGERWSFGQYTQAMEDVRTFLADATRRGLPEEQLIALAEEAEARQRYRKAKRLMRPDDPATWGTVRQSRDELERCLQQLLHVGGTTAQYASVRLGAPIEYAEVRELLRRK
jgi:hypothetical protein